MLANYREDMTKRAFDKIMEGLIRPRPIFDGTANSVANPRHVPEKGDVRKIRAAVLDCAGAFAAATASRSPPCADWEQGRRRPEPARVSCSRRGEGAGGGDRALSR